MNQDVVALAKLRLEEILTFFGINTKVKAEEADDTIELSVEADNVASLIGRRGEALRSLQHVLNMMVRNASTERIYVAVDIAGYKKARAETIASKSRAAAEKVLETGKEEMLPPMNAAERRMVHMALAEFEGIETESVGQDPRRRVVIKKRA